MSSGSAGLGARATLALHRAWCYAKEGVSLKLGPVTLSSRLRRTAPLAANRRLEMHRPGAAAASLPAWHAS